MFVFVTIQCFTVQTLILTWIVGALKNKRQRCERNKTLDILLFPSYFLPLNKLTLRASPSTVRLASIIKIGFTNCAFRSAEFQSIVYIANKGLKKKRNMSVRLMIWVCARKLCSSPA